jgi:DNA topoisomerase-1
MGKKMYKLSLKGDGTKMNADEAAQLALDDIKKMIESQDPTAFSTPAKKTAPKKAAAKKAAPKKAAPKKAATKKAAAKK